MIFSKRYILFGGDIYYPDGGIRDYKGESDSLEGIREKISEFLEPESIYQCKGEYQWYQILDRELNNIVELFYSGQIQDGKDSYNKWKKYVN